MKKCLSALLILTIATSANALNLSDAQAIEIGRRIWKNECAGMVEGLTSWNKGEDFASLGIAHFIWYPQGNRGPFEESFPRLAHYLAAQGKPVADWMLGPCPWKTRAEFMADFNGSRLTALRKLLSATVAEQARFAAIRLEEAVPKMMTVVPSAERARIRANFERVAAESLGFYALMDYVNFKGEGISPTERYEGKGWGLLQVLESMRSGPALHAFISAADSMLTRRVKNAPPSRNESQWLQGWRNRIATYAK